MKFKKVHILGLSNVLKPKIVLDILKDMKSLNDRQIVYLTEKKSGVVVDFCKDNNIKLIIVNHLNILESVEMIRKQNADLLICIGWDKKLPADFLSCYKKCINCHGGLLPDYRGNRAYMPLYANIPDKYGVTIHYMTEKFDDGNIIKQAKLKLYLEETPLIIHRRLCELTALILPESVRLVEEGYEGKKQRGLARYFTSLTREDMDKLRHNNIENLRKGLPKLIAPHKSWELE